MFNDAFSRDNLPRIKDGAYVIDLDGKQSKCFHWFSLFFDTNMSVFFYSFGSVFIPQDVLNKANKNQYNLMNLSCVEKFQEKLRYIKPIYFLPMNIKKKMIR